MTRNMSRLRRTRSSVDAPTEPLAPRMVIVRVMRLLLPRLLPQLRADRPDLKLFLREETSHAACDSLHHGAVDCVLIALPYACGDVEIEVLFEDKLYLAFPGGDPALPGANVKVLPSSIDPAQLLLLEDGHCLKDHALAACNRPELRAGGRQHPLRLQLDTRLESFQ